MKKRGLSVFDFFLFVLLLTIVVRAPLLVNTVALLISYFTLLVTDFNNAANQFSFDMADYFCSLFLLIVIPTVLIFKRKRLNRHKNFSFSHYAAAVILYVFLFAPLITNTNYDFQKDISVTRLLPPFSLVNVLHLKPNGEATGRLEKFLSYKKDVVKSSFDEEKIFIDSFKVAESSILYFQNGLKNKLPLSSVELTDGNPNLTTKLFLLGSDELGRDVFTRIIYGTRVSILVGLCAVILSLIIGVAFGFLAGFSGGIVDVLLSRLNDMFLTFPIIFFIIFILAFFGNSFISVIVVLGFSGWMSLFRIVKGEVVSLKNKDYFITANQLGLSSTRLLFKEALPVIATPVIVNTIFQFGNVVLSESALSFLGLGVGTEYPSWGAMINSGQAYLSQAWWMIFFPGLVIVLTLVTINDFGKKLTQYFNPRLYQ